MMVMVRTATTTTASENKGSKVFQTTQPITMRLYLGENVSNKRCCLKRQIRGIRGKNGPKIPPPPPSLRHPYHGDVLWNN